MITMLIMYKDEENVRKWDDAYNLREGQSKVSTKKSGRTG